MPKRTDIHKILVIGSGPIVIGQAAEFDYSGTQACLALREEGYEVVLINSNPATIMTDTDIADKVYMEPLNLEYVARIIRHERPDAILPSLGGQTGLNLAVQLAKKAWLLQPDWKSFFRMRECYTGCDRLCFTVIIGVNNFNFLNKLALCIYYCIFNRSKFICYK